MTDDIYLAQAAIVKELQYRLAHAEAVLEALKETAEKIEITTPRHVALAHMEKSQEEMAQRRQDAADGIVRTADVPKRRTGRLDPTPEEPMSVEDLNALGEASLKTDVAIPSRWMDAQRVQPSSALNRRLRTEEEADRLIAEQVAAGRAKAHTPWWER